MIEYFINLIEGILLPLGSVGVFSALFIQEIIVFIPSALVMLGAGFVFLSPLPFFSTAFFSAIFFKIVLPGTLGMTLGTLFLYGVFHYFGRPALERFGKYFGVSWEDMENLNKYLGKTYADDLVIFFLRAIPVFPNSSISAFCGLLRFPMWTYFWISFCGGFVRITIMALLGWGVGALYHEYVTLIDRIENYILLGLIFLVMAILVFFFFRKKKVNSLPFEGE